jgi:crotonobetainyl-CoA:carnitine CoA-transferase CaiB-like acyl-CoA transferase
LSGPASGDSSRPLAGIRVIDATQGIAGPYCASILRLYGAEVVKIEPPAGDWGRPLGAGVNRASAISIANSFGKRALCLDAEKPAGRAALVRLAQRCDVFLENFRPGVMARLGASYEAVAEMNATVIYCSITGFGQTGPLVDKAATDGMMQAFSGMAEMNKDAAGTPRRIGMYAIDTVTGMYAAQAVTAALFGRMRSGIGKKLDITLLNSAAAFQAGPILDHAINFALNRGVQPAAIIVPAGIFDTMDGRVSLGALNDGMFCRIAEVIGRAAWKDGPRYATVAARARIADEINAEVAAVLRTQSTAHWVEQFDAADSLCSAVNDYPAMLAHPQTQHAGFMRNIVQEGIGPLPLAAVPGTVGDDLYAPLPAIGADTRAVLADYGFTASDIDALIDSGAAIQS